METNRGDIILSFGPYFDICHNQGDIDVTQTRRPLFTPKQIYLYQFVLEPDRNPRILNADRRITPPKNVQSPH